MTLGLYNASAQTTSDRQKELTKANKVFMKQLKEQYNLKYINVVVEDDGYWYYQAYMKEDKTGVLNQQGKIIVPIKYHSIKYKKPLEEVAGDKGCSYIGRTRQLYYRQCHQRIRGKQRKEPDTDHISIYIFV